MTFADFSKRLSKIDATPKRLEITDLLIELIKETNPGEIEKAVNLSLGQLAPLYKDIDFNMAEKMMVKAVSKATGEEITKVTAEFKTIGDLGQTVEKLKAGITNSSKLSVTEVFDRLLTIAQDSGENSQTRKIDKTAGLLGELDPLSAKYAVRIILGNLRLGFSDRTVLDALSKIVAGDKSARKKLEEIYNVRPDIGRLTKEIKNLKLKIKNFQAQPELGTPILPSLCQRLEGTEEIVEKMGAVAAEPKWDGQRIQAHVNLKDKPHIQLFTRGLEDVSIMFPDLVNGLRALIQYSVFRIQNCILDGEVVAFDPKTNKILPFQTMITRKRKYGVQEQLLNVPVRYMVFDIMYFNGESLMNKPFFERRKILEKILDFRKTQKTQTTRGSEEPESLKARNSGVQDLRLSDASDSPSFPSVLGLAPQLITSDPAHIRNFLKRQIDSGLEGIVAKRLDSPYSPGRTGFSWVKLKWEGKAKSGGLVDTVDCVVMGIYAGQGKRAGFGAGAFLVGILNTECRIPNNKKKQTITHSEFPARSGYAAGVAGGSIQNSVFVTISKIGTGLTDEQWRELKTKSKEYGVRSRPKEYNVPDQLTPDFWVTPKIVVEIQADNITVSPLHTAGFALRFPRLVRYRDDKSPQQATTVEEVKQLYKLQ